MAPFQSPLVDGLPLAVLIILVVRIIFRPVTFGQSIERLRVMLLIHWAMVAWWCAFVLKDLKWFQEEYPTAYALSLLTNLFLLPFLFVKPLGRKLWFVMMMSAVANYGHIFLLVTILRTYDDVTPDPEIKAAISGLVVGVVLVILELVFRNKALQSPNALIRRWPLFLLMSALILCGVLHYFGDRITSMYCCHNYNPPPYEYFYVGFILEKLGIFTAVFLIYSYIETFLKQRKPLKTADQAFVKL